MRAWLYSIIRNEEKILPYFLRHYTTFVDKLIFYDDESTDATPDLIRACPKAELRAWPGEHGIVDDQFLEFANRQWREAVGKADWIIWVDADEFLYHPDMSALLAEYLSMGVTLPQINGFTMVSDKFPTTEDQIYDEVRTGFPDNVWAKQAIFRSDIVWQMGRHSVNREQFNFVLSPTVDIKLLHYRCLGMDYLRARHAKNWARVPERCRRMSLGLNCDPNYKEHHGVKWFEEVTKTKWGNVI